MLQKTTVSASLREMLLHVQNLLLLPGFRVTSQHICLQPIPGHLQDREGIPAGQEGEATRTSSSNTSSGRQGKKTLLQNPSVNDISPPPPNTLSPGFVIKLHCEQECFKELLEAAAAHMVSARCTHVKM